MRSFLSLITPLLWLIIIFLTSPVFGQDLIFSTKNQASIPCVIEEIANGKVYYLTAASSKVQKLPLKKVAMVLKSGAEFIVPTNDGVRMNAFGERNYDLVFGLNGDAFAASEVSINSHEISYTDYSTGTNTRITSDLVAGVLYKNNLFKPIGDIDLVAQAVLLAQKPEIRPFESESTGGTEPSDSSPVPEMETITEAKTRADESELKTQIDTGRENPDSSERSQSTDEGPALPVDPNEFQEKARSKVRMFANYVEQILESDDNVRANQLIKSTISLFVSDSCTVEVSNVRTKQNVAYPVRRYLNRLKLVRDQYSRIEVSSGEFLYVSDLRKQGDKLVCDCQFCTAF